MSPPARDPGDDPLDELFAVPLAEFVKTRDRLAAEVRKQGDKDRAAQIKALAKPTPAAWAVNQAARASPEAIQGLLDASDRMARLQLRAGDPDTRQRFEEATADHRSSMNALVALASRASGHAAAPAVLERVANNLRWGALDDDARPLLVQGRLQRDLAPAGFGAFAAAAGDDTGDDAAEEDAVVDLQRRPAQPAPTRTGPTPAGAPTLRSVPAPAAPSARPGAPAPHPRASPPSLPSRAASPPSVNSGVLRAQLREVEKRVKQAEKLLERRAAAAEEARAVVQDLERRAATAREALRAAEQARSEAEALFTQEEASRQDAAAAVAQATSFPAGKPGR